MPNKTHYENLKVARDAPSDVIRAAYKALSQKYSSDRNPSADARKRLEIINTSNAILSNPVKRAEYDKWLLEQEPAHAQNNKSDKKPKLKKINDDFDDGKEIIIGKESDVSAYKKQDDAKRWLIYAAIGLAAMAVLGWVAFGNDEMQGNDNQALPANQTETAKDVSGQSASADAALTKENKAGTHNKPDITAIDVPAHDKASIGQFLGLWKSSANVAAGQNSLDISSKSEHSLVFRLDAKAGQGNGGVYGIAEYQDNYALFFNEEDGCSILFTIKSNILQLTTSSCQEYHGAGVAFDGAYMKPAPVAAVTKTSSSKNETGKATTTAANAVQPPQTGVLPVTVVKNTPKLYKFTAKVRDAEGNVSDIELIAKDKDAARAIIRDFRGNPEVLKIKQLKK